MLLQIDVDIIESFRIVWQKFDYLSCFVFPLFAHQKDLEKYNNLLNSK